MFIDKDQKRANYNVICNLPDAQGTKWPHPLTAAQLAELGYTEIPDPVPPTPPEGLTVDEAFIYNELTDTPYAQWTPKAPEQLKAILVRKFEGALDAHLDATAREHRYNDRFTFALRAGYAGPFHAEGVAFAQWMDSCNAQAYQLLLDVEAGAAVMPESIEAFIATLPVFTKP